MSTHADTDVPALVVEREDAPLATPDGVSLDQILRLQDEMLAKFGKPFGDTDDVCPVTHHFAPGLYAREMFIPAGTAIVGKMHRFSHLNTVSKGRILVASVEGRKEVVAPATFMSTPGVKRVGLALEDTVWTTYHPTEQTELAAIEAEVIEPEAASIAHQGVEAIR